MNKHIGYVAASLAMVIVFVTANDVFAVERIAESSPWVKQAIELNKEKEYQRAIEVAGQAIKSEPNKWLAHALLSFFYWENSDQAEAITEGKIATRLAPRNPRLLMNLGRILLASGAPEDAVGVFEKARKLTPNDSAPWIGLTESLALSERSEESLSVLSDMSRRSKSDFTWSYAIGQYYLLLDRPELAIGSATKTMSLASSPGERANTAAQLFLAYLRNGQVERAKALWKEVFSNGGTSDAQVYIFGASALLRSLEPADAKDVLNLAIANLSKPDDADIFFKLARIFEEKADLVSFDKTKYGAWLNNEEAAYRQAIKLNSEPSIYHLGLSAILGQKHMTEEMVEELFKAHSNEPLDQLTGYLLSKLVPGQDSSLRSDSSSVNASCIKLTKAQININGVSCSCKRGMILQTFRRCRGVVFSNIPAQAPYKATVLIDESMISVAEVLNRLTQTKPNEQITYQLLSTHAVNDAGAALQLDERSRAVDCLAFINTFPQVGPSLPTEPDRTVVCK